MQAEPVYNGTTDPLIPDERGRAGKLALQGNASAKRPLTAAPSTANAHPEPSSSETALSQEESPQVLPDASSIPAPSSPAATSSQESSSPGPPDARTSQQPDVAGCSSQSGASYLEALTSKLIGRSTAAWRWTGRARCCSGTTRCYLPGQGIPA